MDEQYYDRVPRLEINYYCNGKVVGTTQSTVYPHYHEGDTIELNLMPTERDLRRAPLKIKRTFFIIDRVNHVIKETGLPSRTVTLGLDVILLEPDPLSDSDTRTINQIAADTIKKRRKNL